MQRIGILGASFNPPTLGHRDVINQALPYFDEFLLVPSLSHPFRKSLAPIEHRLAMLNIFFNEWPESEKARIKISLIEKKLFEESPTKGPIYTYDILCALNQHYLSLHQPFQLSFILGPDNKTPAVWQKFYRYQDIEKNWPLFVVKEHLPVHSTQVRDVCTRYQHDDAMRKKALIELVGLGIANYIEEHHLYRENSYEKRSSV